MAESLLHHCQWHISVLDAFKFKISSGFLIKVSNASHYSNAEMIEGYHIHIHHKFASSKEKGLQKNK
jgi:hypothetical protein